ncbi:YkgJ family cysteine cluster protein [bacterium]|nr:YkgJ family cysteine cluster protein [bacterium]
MWSYEEDYLGTRPQQLCKMCGKCCRYVTTSKSYEELKRLADTGDKGALDFLEIFEPYESIEAVRNIDAQTVDNIINTLIADGNFNKENMTFYYCKYLQDDNLCSNYDNRKDLCKHFPSTPWAIVPPNCGFEGWLFAKREEIKQRVRKEKEELIDLKVLKSKTTDEETLKKIELVEQKLQRNIDMYKKYGSEDW